MIRSADAPPQRPDPVLSLSVALLVITGLCLLALAIGATYTYNTWPHEAVLAGTTGAVFGVTLLINVVAVTWRHFARGRS